MHLLLNLVDWWRPTRFAGMKRTTALCSLCYYGTSSESHSKR
jgi:hypothetical protein